MNQNNSSFRERIFHLYLDCILRRHKLVVISIFVFMSILIAGIPRLTISNDFRVYFSTDNPQLAALDELEQTYSKQDNLYFLIRPIDTDRGGPVCEPALPLRRLGDAVRGTRQ